MSCTCKYISGLYHHKSKCFIFRLARNASYVFNNGHDIKTKIPFPDL